MQHHLSRLHTIDTDRRSFVYIEHTEIFILNQISLNYLDNWNSKHVLYNRFFFLSWTEPNMKPVCDRLTIIWYHGTRWRSVMHQWKCKWTVLPYKPLLSETTSDKNMNLNYWLMWLSFALLTVCSQPAALRNVFALNSASLHNNLEHYFHALYPSLSLSFSVLAHLQH